ncbi:hypothetical protein PS3A_31340 [Pseudomonas sp. 3A(2025)]
MKEQQGPDHDAIACLEDLFIEKTQKARIRKGQCPVRRPVFLNLNGVAHGRFDVLDSLPESLQVGLFAKPGTYPAWVRYSCDIRDDQPVFRETVGLGIKLFDVPGLKCLVPDESTPTLDFLLQNHPVFFVRTASDMCALFRDFDGWVREHPETGEVLDAMKKSVPSVLQSELWSVVPYRFGAGYCKYKVVPEYMPPVEEPDYDDPAYLRKDLRERLATGEARLHFMVQRWTSSDAVPVDDAMVLWDEHSMPAVHVATLTLPLQDIDARSQTEYGEALAYNPWRTLKEHEPVGSIAQARKVVYQASANVRRNYNGQTLGEPQIPRPDRLE